MSEFRFQQDSQLPLGRISQTRSQWVAPPDLVTTAPLGTSPVGILHPDPCWTQTSLRATLTQGQGLVLREASPLPCGVLRLRPLGSRSMYCLGISEQDQQHVENRDP